MGILAVLPLVFFLTYFGFFISLFIELFAMDAQSQSNRLIETQAETLFSNYFVGLFVIVGLMIFSSLGLLIVYLIHIMQNPKLKKNTNLQLLWTLVILFGSFIGAIVYFILEVYPIPPKKIGAPT